jgi:hypothetical protein
VNPISIEEQQEERIFELSVTPLLPQLRDVMEEGWFVQISMKKIGLGFLLFAELTVTMLQYNPEDRIDNG